MKTYLVSILLFGSLGLNIYLLNSYVVTSGQLDDDIVEPIDEIKLAQSAVKKNQRKDKLNQSHISKLEEIQKKFLPEKNVHEEHKAANKETENSDSYESDYNKQKELWKEDVSAFLETELGLDPKQLDDYFNLQIQREKTLSDYFTPKLEVQGGGTYVFDVEDIIASAKINEKYLIMLKQQLGDEGYKKYSDFKKRINKRMMDNGNSYFIMEF